MPDTFPSAFEMLKGFIPYLWDSFWLGFDYSLRFIALVQIGLFLAAVLINYKWIAEFVNRLIKKLFSQEVQGDVEGEGMKNVKLIFPFSFLFCWLVVSPYLMHQKSKVEAEKQNKKIESLTSESERPRVEMYFAGYRFIESNSAVFRREVVLQNTGKRPITNMRSKWIVLDQSLRTIIDETSFSSGNEVSPNAKRPLFVNEKLPENMAGVFMLLEVKYSDSLTRKEYKQQFFMKWRGVTNGEFDAIFEDPTISETEKLKSFAGKNHREDNW